MKYTAIVCHVMVDLVAEGKLHITRNGAGEPGIDAYDKLGSPYSQRRLLTTVQKLHEQAMISLPDKGILGVPMGKAEIGAVGRNRMHHVRRAHEAHKVLAEKHASEQEALRRQHETEIAELGVEQRRDEFAAQKIAAAQRVRAQLDLYRAKLGADMSIASIMVRVSDDTIISLDTADLLLLCDAVEGK